MSCLSKTIRWEDNRVESCHSGGVRVLCASPLTSTDSSSGLRSSRPISKRMPKRNRNNGKKKHKNGRSKVSIESIYLVSESYKRISSTWLAWVQAYQSKRYYKHYEATSTLANMERSSRSLSATRKLIQALMVNHLEFMLLLLGKKTLQDV